ncbi:MAG: FAD-dependent oxidoreductase [Bacteroidales bacterium]
MTAKKTVVTVGAGIAGIESSAALSKLGYRVILVEKENNIGGKINNYYQLFPNNRPAFEIREYADGQCKLNEFTIYRNTEVNKIQKHGNRFSVVTSNDDVLKADAILMSTGFDYFKGEQKEEYGYKIYDNVITSVDLENSLKSGKPLTTTGGKTPKRIAFVHCVGSRDEKSGNHYCSRLCCVTGIKQAMELNHLIPDSICYCFYIDLRMYSMEFESIYRSAQEKYGIQFIRGKVSEISENKTGGLQVKAEDTLSGRPLKMEVDLVVLLVGMVPGKGTENILQIAHLQSNSHGFIESGDWQLHKNKTSQPGIFVAGACNGPMSIDETIEHARSAVFEIHEYLQNSK